MKRILSFIMTAILILCMYGCNSSDPGEVFVRFRFSDHTYSIMPEDVEIIRNELGTKLPETSNTVIPVYSFSGGVITEGEEDESAPVRVYSESILVNGESFISVLAIDKEYAHLLGLDEMADDTAYFVDYYKETIELDNTGITLRTENTVSDIGFYSLIDSHYIDLGTIDDPVCFVNMTTMDKMVTTISDGEYTTASEAAQNMNTVCIAATVIYTDSVKETMEVLSELNYKCSAEYN